MGGFHRIARGCRRSQRLAAVLVPLAVTATVAGCGSIDKAQSDIDGAIKALNNTDVDFRQVLRNLEEELPKERKALISEVHLMLEAATAAAATQVRCQTDFIDQRLRTDLNNLKIISFLLKEKPSSASPWPCGTSPAGLSVDAQSNGEYKTPGLQIYGFDFTQRSDKLPKPPPPSIAVVSTDGHSEPVPSTFIAVQPYDIDVNVTKNAFKLPEKAAKLILSYPGESPFEVVVQPTEGPAPPPPKVSNLLLTFETLDDDKEDDIVMSADLGAGLATYKQNGKDYFGGNTTTFKQLTPSTVPLKAAAGAPFEVCAQRGGPDWAWRFNVTVSGAASNGQEFSVPFNNNLLTDEVRCTKSLKLPPELPFNEPGGSSSGGSGGKGSKGGGHGGPCGEDKVIAVNPVLSKAAAGGHLCP
jgi:hypothetical protein